jgi:pilus assembly protein CpaF
MIPPGDSGSLMTPPGALWAAPPDFLGTTLARSDRGRQDLRLTDDERAAIQHYLIKEVDASVLSPFQGVAGRSDIIRTAIRAALRANVIPRMSLPTTELVDAIYADTVGLGPLDELIRDTSITSITVSRYDQIVFERDGREELASVAFDDEEHLSRVADTLVTQARRTLTNESPSVDLTFDPQQGAKVRVNVNILRPGQRASIALRRGRPVAITLDQMVQRRAIDPALRDWLARVLPAVPGFLVIGVPSTGKTTVLETALAYLLEQTGQRIVICEDPPELSLDHPQAVRYQVPPVRDGAQGFDLARVISTALRANARLLVVGELRGSQESATLLANANSMRAVAATLHGKSIELGLKRLLSLVMGDPRFEKQSPSLVCDLIAGAFPLLIQTDILPNGHRLVRRLAWLRGGDESGNFVLDTLFEVRATYEQGELSLTWEASDVELPHSLREELALYERERAQSVQGQLVEMLFRDARLALAAAQWADAAALLERVLTQASDRFAQVASDLSQALRHAGRWSEAEDRAAQHRARLSALADRWEWDVLERQLGVLEADFLARLVLEQQRHRWLELAARGRRATESVNEAIRVATSLHHNGDHELALHTIEQQNNHLVTPDRWQALARLHWTVLGELAQNPSRSLSSAREAALERLCAEFGPLPGQPAVPEKPVWQLEAAPTAHHPVLEEPVASPPRVESVTQHAADEEQFDSALRALKTRDWSTARTILEGLAERQQKARALLQAVPWPAQLAQTSAAA